MTNTFYIDKCESYFYNDQGLLTCDKCETGYVKGRNGGCYIDTSIKNCVLAASATLCDKCAETHVLVNRLCETPNIENCDQYWNNR